MWRLSYYFTICVSVCFSCVAKRLPCFNYIAYDYDLQLFAFTFFFLLVIFTIFFVNFSVDVLIVDTLTYVRKYVYTLCIYKTLISTM